jgi:hypothetical protein
LYRYMEKSNLPDFATDQRCCHPGTQLSFL